MPTQISETTKQVKYDYNRKWRKLYPEKERAYKVKWRAKNRLKIKEYGAKWRKENPHKKLADHLRRKYGITLEDRAAMLRNQKEKCANTTCLADISKKCFVDHNHISGTLRELLCLRCNTLLGFLERSPERLRGLLAYQEKHKVT